MGNTERNTNKPGKFAKKRKKRFPVVLILVLLLALAVGIWWMIRDPKLPAGESTPAETNSGETAAPIETTAPGDTAATAPFENTEPTYPTETTPVTRPSGDYELPQAYIDVLNRYAQAVAQKWDFIQCEENQICYMVMFREDLSTLGYHTPDLDHDGVRELIISDGNVIYDLYTLDGEELVWLLSGGERNSYQLCHDGFIFNHGSASAASFQDNVYYVKNGQLILKEGILFDGSQEPATWLLSGEGIETPEKVNANRYQEMLDSYQKVSIPLTPFPDTP